MRGRLTAESPSQTEARKRHFIACDERRPRSPVAGLITAKRCHQILMDSSSKSSPFGINAVTISRSEGSPGSRTASRATISRRETARSSTPVIASSRPGPDTLARPKAISVAPQPSSRRTSATPARDALELALLAEVGLNSPKTPNMSRKHLAAAVLVSIGCSDARGRIPRDLRS